jgi:hypothetical protein
VRTFKTLFAAIFAAGLCASASAQIASDFVNVGLNQTYGTIAAQGASNTVAVLDQRKQSEMTIQFSFKSDATASDNITLVFLPSLDGSKYGATGYPIITALTTGGVEKTIVTNLPAMRNVRYWKLAFITNAAAAATLTNYSLGYSIKTGL